MSANPTTTPAVPGVSASLLASLRGKIDKIDELFKQATGALIKLRNSPRLTMGATTSEIDQARREIEEAERQVRDAAARDLEELKGETERQRAEVMKAILRAIGRPEPAGATEALLREQRELRAWNRIKPMLDREPSSYPAIWTRTRSLALEAIAAGDDDALAALRVEIGTYLMGRGLSNVDATNGRAQLDTLIGGERPAVAAALALQREVEQGIYAVLLAVNYVTHAIKTGSMMITVLGWDGKTARAIAAPGVDVKTGRINPNMGKPLGF
jgi:hypothetical protein